MSAYDEIDALGSLPDDVVKLWMIGLQGVTSASKQRDDLMQAQISELWAEMRTRADDIKRLDAVLSRPNEQPVWGYMLELVQAIGALRLQLLEVGIQPCYPVHDPIRERAKG